MKPPPEEFSPFCSERVWREQCTLGSSAVDVISQVSFHDGFASQMQTLLPSTSGTGNDRGLVFILRPEQAVCTWYLETGDTKPVQSVALTLSYSERGNSLSKVIRGVPRYWVVNSSVVSVICLWNPKEHYPGKIVYYGCGLFNQSVSL
jgi:hypothetical protein